MVPTDALGKYKNLSLKQLDKKLTDCMTELKKYENVNKKALDQFVRANSEKETLVRKVNEAAKDEKVSEMINNFVTGLFNFSPSSP